MAAVSTLVGSGEGNDRVLEAERALGALRDAVRGDARTRALSAQRILTEISQHGQVREQIAAARRDAVNELRAAGMSLGSIAELLGIARGTVQQISEGRDRVVLGRGRVRVPPR